MWPKRNYLEDARKHERIFRNILSDIRKEEELTLEEIYEKYSTGNRVGIWTIIDFRVGPYRDKLSELVENEALFAIKDIGPLSGHGRIAKYKVAQDASVTFDSNISFWMS